MKTLIDDTPAKLVAMLTENTGRSFLDSGSAYGRNWERNQAVDFEAQPTGQLEFWNRDGELDILPEISVYHFLRDRLEYNPELDQRYRAYVEQEDTDLDYHSAQSFAESIGGAGIYGDGNPFVENTYNGEDLLSQILQYVYWEDDDGAHVLLQIHGGCDARGGYSDPVAFDVEETSIFDNARATIYCGDCSKSWDTDDGCHWYATDDGPDLHDYPAVESRPDYPRKPDSAQRTLPIELPERPQPDIGVIWVDNDQNGHCPRCGGLLDVAPWPAG